MLKKYRVVWQWILTLGIIILYLGLLLFFNYLNVVENKGVPRFRLSVTYTSEGVMEYNTLFYKFFRINHDTLNEYYIVDNYPNYFNVFNNDKINKNNFNKYVEKRINDNSFIEDMFEKFFDK